MYYNYILDNTPKSYKIINTIINNIRIIINLQEKIKLIQLIYHIDQMIILYVLVLNNYNNSKVKITKINTRKLSK